jgi:hypothetical protein
MEVSPRLIRLEREHFLTLDAEILAGLSRAGVPAPHRLLSLGGLAADEQISFAQSVFL